MQRPRPNAPPALPTLMLNQFNLSPPMKPSPPSSFPSSSGSPPRDIEPAVSTNHAEFASPMPFIDFAIESCPSPSTLDLSDTEKSNLPMVSSIESSEVNVNGGSEATRTTRLRTIAQGAVKHSDQNRTENAAPSSSIKKPRKPRARKKSISIRRPSIPESADTASVSAADQLRRERNRIAANRCRDRTKSLVNDLKMSERNLTAQRNLLQSSLQDLQEQIYSLKQQCFDHVHCDCGEIRNYLLHSNMETDSTFASPQTSSQHQFSPNTNTAGPWDDVDSVAINTADYSWTESAFPNSTGMAETV